MTEMKLSSISVLGLLTLNKQINSFQKAGCDGTEAFPCFFIDMLTINALMWARI